MRLRVVTLIAIIIAAASVLPARADDAKPAAATLVVRLNSIDGLLADLRFLAEAAGKGNEAKQIEGIIKQFAGPKGIEGFDTTRPMALYGRLATKIEESDLVLLLPVADEHAVLELLKRQEIKVEDAKGGVYKVEIPRSPFPGYFRFANRSVYLTVRDARALDKERLLAPAAVLPEGVAGTFEMVLNIDEIPQTFKDLVVGQASLRLSEGKGEKKESEREAEYKFRTSVVDELANQLKAIITEGKELSLKLNVDRKSADVVASVRFTPKPGTKLADSIAELGQAKSIVANLGGSDSALSGRIFATIPQGLRKAYDALLEDGVKRATAEAPDAAARDLAVAFFKALGPTLKAGELDIGLDMRGPAANGRYTALAAIAVKDGVELDKIIRALRGVIPEEVRQSLVLDAARAGGVSIHRLTVPEDKLDAGFKKVFGNTPFFFAIRKDGFLIGMGDGALDALKDVVAREPKAGAVMNVDLSVARLARLDKNEDAVAIGKKVFGKAQDDDKVRLTITSGKALELRLSAQARLLEFATLMEEAKKGEK